MSQKIDWQKHVTAVQEELTLRRGMVANGRIPFDREKLLNLYRDLGKVEKMAGVK